MKCFLCGEILHSDEEYKIHVKIHVNETKFHKEINNADLESEKSFQTPVLMPENHETNSTSVVIVKTENDGHELKQSLCKVEEIKEENESKRETDASFIVKVEDTRSGLPCPQCDKVLKNSDSLRKHIKRHTTVFQCEKCNKLLTTQYNLNRHTRSHTGEKPFQCNTCGKGYIERKSLDRHQVYTYR